MKKIVKPITRKQLLALPQRKWDVVTVYDSVYIVPTGKKHDSGYATMAIIGVSYVEKHEVGEIAACCDDINWSFPIKHPYDVIRPGRHSTILRTDMFFPSNIIRMWGSGKAYFSGRFKVGISLSSTDIELVIWPCGEGRNPVTGAEVPTPEVAA
jgi:hypothetical protein